MTEIWELCRKLSNPERLALLRKVYESKDGINVGTVNEHADGLKQSGTSQYLGQLWKLGLIRRARSGKYVNYYAAPENAHVLIQDVALALQERFRAEFGSGNQDEGYVPVMRVMGNAMRAKIVGMLAREGRACRKYVCDKTGLEEKALIRHLKPALKIGLVQFDAKEILWVNQPTDTIAKLIVNSYS